MIFPKPAAMLDTATPDAPVERLTDIAKRTATIYSEAMPQLLGMPALRLLSLDGTEELSTLSTYTLELRTPGAAEVPLAVSANLDLRALIGKAFTVSIECDGLGAGRREISGLVTEVSFLRREARYNVYQMVLRPWLWLATLTTDFKIFQNQTVIEILDRVLSEYPYPVEKRLEAEKYRIRGESQCNEPRAFQVQYGESDFHFLQRLMEEWGIYWFFEHADGKHRLVLCDHVGALHGATDVAYRMLPYAPQDNRIDTEYVRSFRVHESLRPGRFAVNDFDFTRPLANLAAANQQPRPTSLNQAERFEWPGGYTDSQHAAHLSRTRMEELRAPGTRASGRGNLHSLVCGQTFTLTGHDHTAANREYFVIASKLTIDETGEESGASFYQFDNVFTVQPTSEIFRPPCCTPKPRANGTQTAIVVGPPGQQVWTDEYGRVKIRFHWDRYARNDETDSCWVRVGQAWAGSNFGGVYIPRVGQEVIVDFLNGDPDRPLIIGSLYNNITRPPWDLPGNATQSGLISRTIGGGRSNYNGVRFEDQPGSEEFHLQAERDMNSVIKNDASTSIGNNAIEQIGLNLTSAIGGAFVRTIGGGMSEIIAESMSSAIGASISQTAGESSETTVGEEYKVTAGKSIKLECGQASFTLKSDGTIELKGSKITVEAGDQLNLSGAPLHLNPGTKSESPAQDGGEEGEEEAPESEDPLEAMMTAMEGLVEIGGEVAEVAAEVGFIGLGEAASKAGEILPELLGSEAEEGSVSTTTSSTTSSQAALASTPTPRTRK